MVPVTAPKVLPSSRKYNIYETRWMCDATETDTPRVDLFGIAFGYVEAAVMVYLRNLRAHPPGGLPHGSP